MKAAKPLAILLAAGLLCALGAPQPATARPRPQVPLANAHLSAITLIQRWTTAVYRFLPAANPGPPASDTGFPPEPDKNGNFIRTIVEADGTRTVITNHGGSAFDYDIDIAYSTRVKEHVEARPGPDLLNGVPTTVNFVHTFSTGDHVEYVQELQQDPSFDFGLNFLYALLWKGHVTLKSGACMDFELRQTKAFGCFNFFTGENIPEAACEEWFDEFELEPDFFIEIPKPDRLHVDLGCGADGALDLTFPLLEPDVLDFGQNATGKFVLDAQRFDVALVPSAEPPGWSIWQTSGPGFEGAFELKNDFSGKGSVFKKPAGQLTTQGSKRQRKLEFAVRWNPRGIGTVVLSGGQTAPAGPFGGALDFQSLKWSGLGAKFGPAPGL